MHYVYNIFLYIFVDQQFDDYLPSPTPRNGFFQVVSGDPRKGAGEWWISWYRGDVIWEVLYRYMISRLVRVGETDLTHVILPAGVFFLFGCSSILEISDLTCWNWVSWPLPSLPILLGVFRRTLGIDPKIPRMCRFWGGNLLWSWAQGGECRGQS